MKVQSEFSPYENRNVVGLRKGLVWHYETQEISYHKSIAQYDNELKNHTGVYLGKSKAQIDVIKRSVQFWQNAPDVYYNWWLN